MLRRLSLWLVLACAVLCVTRAHASVTNLFRLLENRGIAFDASCMSARAAAAVVVAVDPWGRILAEDEHPDEAVAAVDVSAEQLPCGIGYVAVKGFGKGTGLRVGEHLETWSGNGLEGVILDVRGAQGVDLESVDFVAGVILGKTNEVYTVQDAREHVLERHCPVQVPALPAGFPMMVLVDEQTRGSAELLAAVLRGEAGVLVCGNRTPGDSGLREALAMGDGQRVYMATRWLVPSGGSYAQKGIDPDIAVTDVGKHGVDRREAALLLDDLHISEGEKRAALMAQRVASDVVLRRATDVMLGMSALYSRGKGRADARDEP